MKKFLPHILATILLLTLSMSVVHAAGEEGVCTPGTLCNPLKGGGTNLADFLKTILEKIVLPIGAIIAVLAFIFTGFSFVMARGNQAALDNAKRSLLYTSIGTAVLLGAWTIATVISNTVDQLKR